MLSLFSPKFLSNINNKFCMLYPAIETLEMYRRARSRSNRLTRRDNQVLGGNSPESLHYKLIRDEGPHM